MSECVVRMEMPLNCFECPMYDWNRQKLCCNAHLDLRPIPNGGVPKPDWCPIICQLPDGHGDLIDRDSMVEEWVDEKIGNPHADYEADDVIYDLKKRTVIVPKDKANEP